MPLNSQTQNQLDRYINSLQRDTESNYILDRDRNVLTNTIANISKEIASIHNLSDNIDSIISNIKKEKLTVLKIPKKSYNFRDGPSFPKFIKNFNKRIDAIADTLELTQKQSHITGKIHGFIPNDFVTNDDIINSIEKKEIHDNIITKHRKMIIQELEYKESELGPEFDILLSTCIYSILNNATISNLYEIAIGEKDVIYDEIPELISSVYHETKQDKIQKEILDNVKNHESFGIGEEVMQNFKEFFKEITKIKKPNNSFIRTSLKKFHGDYSEFIFTTELFMNKIIGETEELAYLIGDKDEASVLTKTLIILKILDDKVIHKIFTTYLQLEFFLKTGETNRKHQEKKNKEKKNKEDKLKNKENKENKKREKEKREKLVKESAEIEKEAKKKLVIIKRYINTLNNDTEKYLLRLLTNKNQLYINELNDKFQRGLSIENITKLTKESPTHFIIKNNNGSDNNGGKISKTKQEDENKEKANNNNNNNNLTNKELITQNILKQHLDNPTNFTAQECIKIFKKLGYSFLNEKHFIYSFNKELEENFGEQRKKKLLEQMRRISLKDLNIWNVKKIRKVETININPGAYRLVKKDNKIRGIYNHDTYQRNVFVRSK